MERTLDIALEECCQDCRLHLLSRSLVAFNQILIFSYATKRLMCQGNDFYYSTSKTFGSFHYAPTLTFDWNNFHIRISSIDPTASKLCVISLALQQKPAMYSSYCHLGTEIKTCTINLPYACFTRRNGNDESERMEGWKT